MNAADLVAIYKKQPIGYGCALASIVLGALIYIRTSTIEERQDEFVAKSAEAAKVLSNVRNSAGLPEQVAEMQGLAKEFEGRLIGAGSLAINQQYFYKLEAENQVKLLDVRPGPPVRNGKSAYVAVPFIVSVQGPFKQVLSFLQQLENGQHFCRFTSVVFNKSVGASTDTASQSASTMALTINLELLGRQ